MNSGWVISSRLMSLWLHCTDLSFGPDIYGHPQDEQRVMLIPADTSNYLYNAPVKRALTHACLFITRLAEAEVMLRPTASRCRSPNWNASHLRVSWCGHLMWREDVSVIYSYSCYWALPALSLSGPRSLGTRDHILLSRLRHPQPGAPGHRIYCPYMKDGSVIPPANEFLFRRLVRLAGVHWRYFNPPPHGDNLL
jgi:hypothetical protein